MAAADLAAMSIGTAKPMPTLPLEFSPGRMALVDADDPASAVGEHAAGVARVDRGVGLDDLAPFEDPVVGADDPGGHGLVEAEGAADGDRELPDLDVLADGEGRRLEAGAVDLDHADVVELVGAEDLAR